MTQTQVNAMGVPLTERTRLETIPPPLVAVRDMCGELLHHLLRIMFEKADDAFFELAERTQMGAEQKIYLAAKKELRAKRAAIEKNYLESVREGFHYQPLIITAEYKSAIESVLENTSVNDPLFRLLIVFDALVDKANSGLGDILAKITSHLNRFYPDISLNKYNSPLSIYTLTEGFFIACNQLLSLQTEEKIIVLNMFEKHVVSEMNGILIKIQRLLVGSEMSALAADSHKKLNDENAVDVFQSKKAGADNVERVSYDERAMWLANHLLPLQALPFDQRPLMYDESVRVALNEAKRTDVEPMLQQLTAATDLLGIMKETFQTSQANWVQWFESIEVALLRLSILDMSALSRETHPVRRWLAGLFELASDASVSQPAYLDIANHSVKRVVESFENDSVVFAEVWLDYQAAIDNQKRRQEVLVRCAQKPLDLEQQAEISAWVEKTINEVSESTTCSQKMVEFLKTYWAPVLFFAFLEGAEQGRSAQKYKAAAAQMMGILNRAGTESLSGLSRILHVLQEGLGKAGWSAWEIAECLEQLEQLHLEAYAPVWQRVTERLNKKPLTVVSTQPMTEEVDFDFASLLEQMLLEDSSVSNDNSESTQVSGEALLDMKERRLDMQTLVDHLKLETWLEYFPDSSSDKKVRVKLAAILRPSYKFIFVDRDGRKVLEKTRDELVEAFLEGDIKSLDQSSIFGRALG